MRWKEMLLPVAMIAAGVAYVAYVRRPRWWWRYDDEDGTPTMDHLLAIGPNKPMGYIDWGTIYESGLEPYELARRLRRTGLRTMMFEPAPDKYPHGALYAFDQRALQRLLSEHRDVLRDAGWPEDPKAFVRCVSTISVQPERMARLYRLIGRAFDDTRFAAV